MLSVRPPLGPSTAGQAPPLHKGWAPARRRHRQQAQARQLSLRRRRARSPASSCGRWRWTREPCRRSWIGRTSESNQHGGQEAVATAGMRRRRQWQPAGRGLMSAVRGPSHPPLQSIHPFPPSALQELPGRGSQCCGPGAARPRGPLKHRLHVRRLHTAQHSTPTPPHATARCFTHVPITAAAVCAAGTPCGAWRCPWTS